jgi:anti-sigma B factor antagonist
VVLESASVKHRPCADWRTEVEELNHLTNVTNREVDGVSVVTLYGRIVFGEGSNIVREKVKSLIGEGKKKIVLDMKNIDYIDSSGLGALVAAHLSANTEGAAIRLCNLGRKFSKALQLTKLTTVFQVYSTEAAAVASFSE